MSFFKKLFGKKDRQPTVSEIVEKSEVKPLEVKSDNPVALAERSVNENIPILAGSQARIDFYKEISPDIEVYGFAKNYTKSVLSTELPNGVIVDRSIDEEMIQVLRDNNIAIRN
jgi:hypothetical protein